MATFTSNGSPITNPSPQYDIPIICNNGTIKAFCGNKWTDVNKLSGYIIQNQAGEIQQNSNYNVSAPIILKAGDYSVSYYTPSTGARPFTIWECDAQGDLVGDTYIFNITRPNVGTNTGTFTIDRDMLVRVSWRNDFTNIVVAPTTAIIYYDGTVETVTVKPNEREKYYVQYINGYLQTSTKKLVAYSGNSVVTFDCEVGKTYCCINRAMGGQSTSVNIGYSDTIPTIGYVYAQDDFVATSIVDGYYKTTGLVFTAKKRYATFIFRYDGDSSQTPTSMLEQMIFYEVAKKGTATCQPLLSVGNYKDVQNITNGAITRNVGVVVLTGTEIGWMKSTSYQGSFYLNGATALWGTEIGASALCSHLIFKATGESYTSGKFFFDGSLNCWNPDFDSSTTVSTFTQWVADQYAAGTPVIVIYRLKTPTTEAVTGQTLTITQGTNVVTAEGSVSDLELEVSYKAYAEVTVEEIEAVNTDESVEVTIS